MLKLKLQYFGHMMRWADSLEKTLMLGKIEDRRKRGQQRMRWLDGITNSMEWVWVDSRSWQWTGRPGVLQSTGSQRVGHDWVTELYWTELSNQIIDWGRISLFQLIFQLTDETEIIKIRISAFFKPSEWLDIGINHHQWLLTSPQGKQPDASYRSAQHLFALTTGSVWSSCQFPGTREDREYVEIHHECAISRIQTGKPCWSKDADKM